MILVKEDQNCIFTTPIKTIEEGKIFSSIRQYYVLMQHQCGMAKCVRLSDGMVVIFSDNVCVIDIEPRCILTSALISRKVKVNRLKPGDTFIDEHYFYEVVDDFGGRVKYLNLITRKFDNINPKTKVIKVDISLEVAQ